MSVPCSHCSEPLAPSELSLKCANPRCFSVCHTTCSGIGLLNDGGRVPRWRCSSCRLSTPSTTGGYEPVYGRPRPGDTLKRDNFPRQKLETSSLRLHFRDKPSDNVNNNFRSSAGDLLGDSQSIANRSATISRPKSADLTPTSDNNNAIPLSVYSPDEQHEDTVKSFYKWLEDHECSNKVKRHNSTVPSGLVKDKIAQFGDKLENHFSRRINDDPPDRRPPKSSVTRPIHNDASTVNSVDAENLPPPPPPPSLVPTNFDVPQGHSVRPPFDNSTSKHRKAEDVDLSMMSELALEKKSTTDKKFVDVRPTIVGPPKSSATRQLEYSKDDDDDEEDFPPPPSPPPILETDLDVVQIVESHEDDDVINLPANENCRSRPVNRVIRSDSRIVKHASVPGSGQFIAEVVYPTVKGVLVQEVDEGQPCLACEKCQGFEAHNWRKTCNSCKCPRESHDVFHEEWVNVRERLGIGQDQDKWGSRDRILSQGLAWAPPGLPPYKVDQYFKSLPQDKVPKLGTSGEKYREKQLMIQLPKQDLALAYCRHVDPAHHTSYDDFITARNEIALDIAYAKECSVKTDCPECSRSVTPGELGVLAPKFGDKILWHPACFICSHCKQLLVDLTYCVHDDYLYCERHYAEQLKPRCSACDELIFSGEYTKAMSKDWHSGHFCCWQCDESLTGQRYVLRDDHPYCIKCYESVFANTCDECNKTIGIDSKDLSYKDKHWHEACFFCNKCRVSLVDKQFGSKADKIYCGNCYDAQFASRCDGCGQIFRAGTKKMEYKTRQWHEQCFCCCVCKSAIGTKSFIPREQEIYCATCYEEKFATRCVKCNKIITSGGVTYKNEPWHRECFTCTNCNTSLAGQRFTSRDEKPYCADCFGELFAKRCTSCSKPITGIGGTRFISFEDRHWHNACFICASCKTSLVGRGFITDAEDILCTECAKQKLM